MRQEMRTALIAGLAFVMSALLMGAVVPHTFSPGTTISSAEVNANFESLRAAIQALEDAPAAPASGPGSLRAFALINMSDGTVLQQWMRSGGAVTTEGFGAGGEGIIRFEGICIDLEKDPIAVTLTDLGSLGPLGNDGYVMITREYPAACPGIMLMHQESALQPGGVWIYLYERASDT